MLDDLLEVNLDVIYKENKTSLADVLTGADDRLNELKQMDELIHCKLPDDEAGKIMGMLNPPSPDTTAKVFNNFREKKLANVIPVQIGKYIYCFELFVLKVPATQVPSSHKWYADIEKACDAFGFLRIAVPGKMSLRMTGQHCPKGAIHG